MYQNVGQAPKMCVKNLFQLFDFAMPFFKRHVSGQNQVKIDVNIPSGPPCPKLVNVYPDSSTIAGE